MEFLRRTRAREDAISGAWDLVYSLAGMALFWTVGAVLFRYTEGWDYGISIVRRGGASVVSADRVCSTSVTSSF
jgi:hypothetical protein